jgi:1-acyl-sn-glycerol-3-phosphate acyltransferase
MGASLRRPLHFMAKKELFDTPVLGFLIKRTNAFPVKRGQQDVGAFRKAFGLLESGEPLLVFPEGTRSKDGNFGKARAGLGMIACTAQVPAVPVRIINSDKLKYFKKLTVIFGKPVYPPKEYTKESYLEFSGNVLEEIKRL